MIPVIVLAAGFGTTLLVTAFRRADRRPNAVVSLRIAIAVTFTVTGLSHFVGMRDDMITMVPDQLPAPGLIVTITGLLEVAAAIAMASRRLTPWAALGLTALLIAMFPANVNLALHGTDLPWSQQLVPRTLIQGVFLAVTSSLALVGFARRRRSATMVKMTYRRERNVGATAPR